MPSDIGGIPLHPLVVHAVVVLLPLAAVGVLLIAVVPAWRKNYATLVLVITAIATAAVPVATSTGEDLQETVSENPLVHKHAQLGDTALWFALPLLACAVALWWVARKERADQAVSRGFVTVVAVVSVVVALATTVQVVRIGHSGAKSVWQGTPVSSAGGESGEG